MYGVPVIAASVAWSKTEIATLHDLLLRLANAPDE